MDIKGYIQKEQKRIHELVVERFSGYYLTGGTALSFHFHHRFSEDLDFFTQRYDKLQADKIMQLVSKKTKFPFQLVFEQNSLPDRPIGPLRGQAGLKLLPIKMYTLTIDHGLMLKIDIVQDPYKNIQKIQKGMHSIEDIYYRKVFIALNPRHAGVDDTGREFTTTRQEAKDLFDIYYLSKNYRLLEEFFPIYFSPALFNRLDAWYRTLDRREMMLDLGERIEGIDPRGVFEHLDDQIIRKMGQRKR